MILSFYIFARKTCIFYEQLASWEKDSKILHILSVQFTIQIGKSSSASKNPTPPSPPSQEHFRLLHGLLLTMKSLSQQLSLHVSSTAKSPPRNQAFNSFDMGKTKFHCLELPTGLYFVLVTQINQSSNLDLSEYLRQIYQELYVPLVIRNPGRRSFDQVISSGSDFHRSVCDSLKRMNDRPRKRLSSASGAGR